jgi:hypothetical protein
MATAAPEGACRAVHRWWEGFQSLSFVLPQSSSSARYAFDGVRAQVRDLHTENIGNLAVRARAMSSRSGTARAIPPQ